MAINLADVKKLRDVTGAGMMDAKNALTEAEGDFEAAIELLRISGQAKMAKRAGREASNGLVAGAGSTLLHFACETDFVAKNEEFVALAAELIEALAAAGVTDTEAAAGVTLASGESAAEAVAALSAKSGEKLELADIATYDGSTVTYLHRRSQDLPPQVGVLVEYTGEDPEFVRGIAMQIAAMSPAYVTREDVPEDVLAKERHVAEATAREEGKPEKIIGKIVEGRLNGFFKEVCLVEQASVSDDKKTVGQLLKENDTTVTRFARFSAGG